jgi:hypothetical protein
MTTHGVQLTQHELQEAFEIQREIAEKQRRLDGLISDIKVLLFAKMPIEEGRFYAKLIFKREHHPAWKQAVIDNLGIDFAERFRKSSPSTVRAEVLVEEHAIPPLWKGAVGNIGEAK